jgi:glutamate synthase (NADPH/NADH) large chain
MGVLPIPAERRSSPSGACSRARCCSSISSRAASSPTRRSRPSSRPPSLQAVAGAHPDRARGPAAGDREPARTCPLLDRQQAFGYTQEDLKILLAPMATTGQEAVGSMGTDTPISALSDKSKLLYTYFKQNFAQVTNPPIDPIREELVMSLVSFIGPRPNLLDLKGTSKRKRLEVRQPILTNEDLEKIRAIGDFEDNPFRTKTLDITYPVSEGAAGMERRSTLCAAPKRRCTDGYNIIILSDRAIGFRRPRADPGAAGHRGRASSPDPQGPAHLGRPRRRDRRAARGASLLRCSPAMAPRRSTPISPSRRCCDARRLPEEVDEPTRSVKRYIKAIGKGILKVMSKMGISTYQSYCGAQIFDAVGLSERFRRRSISPAPRPRSRASASPRSPRRRCAPRDAFGDAPVYRRRARCRRRLCLPHPRRGACLDAETVSLLQHAVRGNSRTSTANSPSSSTSSRALRPSAACSASRRAEEDGRKPVPLDEVEPAAISSSASPPAPCRSARSRARRTRRSPSP